MIYRIFPERDTFITNFKRFGTPQSASNFGGSEIMSLFSVAPLSMSSGIVSGSLARVLMKFDLSELVALTASGEFPSTGMSYRLRLADAQHAETLPSSFDVEVQPLAEDWDEGKGQDLDSFSDKDFANWDRPKSNSFWSVPGASGSGPIVSMHFDTGHEDLSVDVTTLVQDWLDDVRPNYGFVVKLSSSLELSSVDYFVKKFHSRTTHFLSRRPYLEVSFDDSVKDDRNNFAFDTTGSLYIYNVVRGALTDVPGVALGNDVLSVEILDASGTVMTVSGSHTGITGIYSATFVVPTGSYSGSTFFDVWSVPSGPVLKTGSFNPQGDFARVSLRPGQLFVNITNLKDSYESSEVENFDMFIRDRDYNPAVVNTASSDVNGKVVTKAYYRIDDERTDEVVVPFGTGSIETTRLSYGQRGNSFKFYMKSLPPKNVYRVVLLFDVEGRRTVVDGGWKFRII